MTEITYSEKHEKKFSGTNVRFSLLPKSIVGLLGCSKGGLDIALNSLSSIYVKAGFWWIKTLTKVDI